MLVRGRRIWQLVVTAFIGLSLAGAMVTGCSEGTHPATSVRTLDDAKAKANSWVDRAIDATIPSDAQRTVRGGDQAGAEYPGTERCDPQDGHHESYSYEVVVHVDRSDVDRLSLAAWRSLERQGFSLNERPDVSERIERGVPPGSDSPTSWSILSTNDGFNGEVTGNRIDSVVYVGVTTPCFDTNQ